MHDDGFHRDRASEVGVERTARPDVQQVAVRDIDHIGAAILELGNTLPGTDIAIQFKKGQDTE